MSDLPDGRSWRDYFRDYKESLRAPEEAPPEQIEIIELMVSITDFTGLKGAAATVGRRLAAQGWDVFINRSVARIPAVRYMTDSETYSKGDVRIEAFDQETSVLIGVKRAAGKALAVEATWYSKGGFQGAITYDPWLGEEIRRGWKKGRKQNQIEAEEGVQPPMGLEEWLNIVAPTAASKKRAAAKAAEPEQKEEVWNG